MDRRVIKGKEHPKHREIKSLRFLCTLNTNPCRFIDNVICWRITPEDQSVPRNFSSMEIEICLSPTTYVGLSAVQSGEG